MKLLAAFFCLILFSLSSSAQTSDEILATANNQNFTLKDLSPIARESFENLPQKISSLRTELLARQIADVLLNAEASARKITVEKLIAAEMKRRVPNPTEAEIKALFDANRAAFGSKTLAEVRPQILAYLRREPEQKALETYIASLKTKYKVVLPNDVNAANLKPTDVLTTINGKQITAQVFEEKAKPTLYETQMSVYELVRDSLEKTVYSALISTEAKSLGLESEDFVAREITNKMKDFSTEEREQLETNLEKRLFEKYNVKFLLKEPAPFVQNISTDDDPARGKANAPVTVVMFSDFQCPACAATHPVLQKVLAEYGDKIRFVVRDFPLTQIHNNSFKAAQAATAANAQGKFFEYIELLYKNQDSLDTASLKRFASEISLNRKQFDADLDGGKFSSEVKKDMQDGVSYGVNSTPTIFVNGVQVRELSARSFRNAIERALKK